MNFIIGRSNDHDKHFRELFFMVILERPERRVDARVAAGGWVDGHEPGSAGRPDVGRVVGVEQLVAAASDVFLGTWWSTFTGYITRVRGYRHKRNATFYVLKEYRDAFVRRSPPPGGAAWWREWPTAFELIDDAPA